VKLRTKIKCNVRGVEVSQYGAFIQMRKKTKCGRVRKLNKYVYQCVMECGYMATNYNRDGQSCPDCGAALKPIGHAKPEDKIGWHREPVKKRVSIDDKLQYLDRLIQIDGQQTAFVEQQEVEKRMKRVCNSIEKDLGLSVNEHQEDAIKYAGSYVTVPIDTDNLVKAVRDAVMKPATGGIVTSYPLRQRCSKCKDLFYESVFMGHCSTCRGGE